MTSAATTNVVRRLQQWFHAQCNGEWEHDEGVVVESLDNPGWMIQIRLTDTPLANKPFVAVERRYDNETEWLTCSVRDGKFSGYCGPEQLEEMLDLFLSWAEES